MKRTTALRISLAIGVLATGYVGFRLFEPQVTAPFGWHQLPAVPRDPLGPSAHIVDPAWRTQDRIAVERLYRAREILQAPALSGAISIDGRQIWAGAVGFADIETGRRATLDTGFRIGSSSKAVTSLVVGTLIDRGLLDIDAPIQRYIPDYPRTVAPITVRRALSHTAGIRNYGWCWCFPADEYYNRRAFASGRASLTMFENDPLVATPGTRFAYTSLGFNIAGATIEAVTQKPFLDYLDESVLKPLGMPHSGGDVTGMRVADLATFYRAENGSFKRELIVDNSNKYPSGGLRSTPSDMGRLAQGIMTDAILTARTRAMLLTPQTHDAGAPNPQGYALGWRVQIVKGRFGGSRPLRTISHNGTAAGSTSYFVIYPELGLVVSLMMNKGQKTTDALAEQATLIAAPFAEMLMKRKAPIEASVH